MKKRIQNCYSFMSLDNVQSSVNKKKDIERKDKINFFYTGHYILTLFLLSLYIFF